jgi:hypothetical protein
MFTDNAFRAESRARRRRRLTKFQVRDSHDLSVSFIHGASLYLLGPVIETVSAIAELFARIEQQLELPCCDPLITGVAPTGDRPGLL